MSDLNTLLIYQQKLIGSLDELVFVVDNLKSQGFKIVLTSGTFDILHVGHGRYLSMARSQGDILIVGLDGDKKVKARKGPTRPVVDENERAEMLSYLAAVDYLYIKQLEDARWALIRAVQPEVLVISERSEYSDYEISELMGICGSVMVLEPQAQTSTTGRIRSLVISSVAPLLTEFEEVLQHIEQFRGKLLEITGGDR